MRLGVYADHSNGLVVQAAGDQDIYFRLGRDAVLSIRGIESELEHVQTLNADISAAIENVTAHATDMTERVAELSGSVKQQDSAIIAHTSTALADLTAQTSSHLSRVEAAQATIAAGDAELSSAINDLTSQLPTLHQNAEAIVSQLSEATKRETSNQNVLRKELEKAELVSEILAGTSGELNDTHSSIFQTVSTLLTNEVRGGAQYVIVGGKRGGGEVVGCATTFSFWPNRFLKRPAAPRWWKTACPRNCLLSAKPWKQKSAAPLRLRRASWTSLRSESSLNASPVR